MLSRMRAIDVVFPIFNFGQAGAFALALIALIIVGLTGNWALSLYVGVGGYLGIVFSSILLGLAPSEAYVSSAYVNKLINTLNSSPNLVKVDDNSWALKKYTSWLWKSDRLSIDILDSHAVRIKGRRRDLKILLSELDK
jgi:hypothetical protein